MGNINGILSADDVKYRDKLQDNGRIYMAEIMDARTPLRNGDLKVWIIKTNSDRKNPKNWITAKCVSPMFGCTANKDSLNTDENISFGWWNPMPYVGNYVFVFFPNVFGDNSACYWFGSPMDVSNCMLPGISYDLTTENNTDYKPVCDKNYLKKKNKNKNQTQDKNQDNVKDKPKEYKVLSEALKKQGLDKDRLRGISTASSFRETPSHCYGFLSPLGNQFVIDDGWVSEGEKKSWIEDSKKETKNDAEMHKGKDDYGYEHINKAWKAELKEGSKGDKLNRFHGGFRLRTRNGTQLLVLDCGTIYMINKDGSAWVEITDDGYIDCFSEKGVSVASDGDINLYSKKSINIESDESINMSAKKGIMIETPGQINANSGTFNTSANITTENISANTATINSLKSSNAELNGIFSGSLQGTAYYATYAGTTPIKQEEPNVKEQEIIGKNAKIKKHKTNDSESVVSRKPTHEPWKEHDKNKCIPELKSCCQTKNNSSNVENSSGTNENNNSSNNADINNVQKGKEFNVSNS